MSRHSPGPWKVEDNEGRSYKVVAADGTIVCYIHYPKTIQEAGNIRLIENLPKLSERFKAQVTTIEAYLRMNGEDPKKDNSCVANQKFILDLEVRDAPRKPPGEGG